MSKYTTEKNFAADYADFHELRKNPRQFATFAAKILRFNSMVFCEIKKEPQ